MLSKKTFLEGIEKLQAAFNYSMTEAQLGIYYETLKELNDKGYNEAVKLILRSEHRFPSIATIFSSVQSFSEKPAHLRGVVL